MLAFVRFWLGELWMDGRMGEFDDAHQSPQIGKSALILAAAGFVYIHTHTRLHNQFISTKAKSVPRLLFFFSSTVETTVANWSLL